MTVGRAPRRAPPRRDGRADTDGRGGCPSNTPMTANSGPSLVRAARRRRRRRRSRPQPSAARGAGERVDEDLVRRQPAVPHRGDRNEAPGPIADADRGRRGIARRQRRADELAARDRRDLAIAETSSGSDSRPASIGSRSDCERVRPVGGGFPHVARAGSPRRAGTGRSTVRLRAPRYAPLPTARRGRGRAPGYTSPRSTRRRGSRSAGPGRESSQSTRSSRWIVTSRGASSTGSPARAIA